MNFTADSKDIFITSGKMDGIDNEYEYEQNSRAN